MSTLPLSAIEQRLKTIEQILDVQGAVDFSAISQQAIPVSPMAFVLPLGTDPSGNVNESIHAPILQDEILTFGVVIAVKNETDSFGHHGNQQLEELRELVKQKLMGWQPAEGYKRIWLHSGRLLPMKDYTVFWQQAYRTSTTQQGYAND